MERQWQSRQKSLAANNACASKELDVALSLSMHTRAHTRKTRVHCNCFER